MLEPLHGVDDLERGADDEVGGPVQPAAQDDRLAVGFGLPRRGARRCAESTAGARR